MSLSGVYCGAGVSSIDMFNLHIFLNTVIQITNCKSDTSTKQIEFTREKHAYKVI